MTNKPSYILGINAYDHDVSACLLKDGRIAYAIEKERITRRKHATGFFQEVVDYVLDAEGITLRDVDLVVRNCYVLPVEDLESRLVYEDVPEFMDLDERDQAKRNPLFLSTAANVVTLSHHMGHAYSAFAACPFDEGAVMIVDGVGSYATDIKEPGQLTEGVNPLARESESYYTFKGSDLTCIRKVWLQPVRGFLSDEFYFMPGLGAMYSRVSSYIFSDWNKCGEVMGLAPYGRPNAFPPLVTMKDGELQFPEWDHHLFNKPFSADSDAKWEASPHMQHWQDIAWRMQDDSENILIERARWLRETTGAKNLCLAGGVALNCVANGRIVREAGFENVWVQPAAGDNGIAIGCAYYGHLALQKKPRSHVIDTAYFGRSYPESDVKEALARVDVKLATKSVQSADICADTAKLLSEGHIFGWYQGGCEYGPRALGNRSILADPRKPEAKDIVNKRVKHRQSFRPFAPIVLAERSAEIFEGEEESPFMLLAKNVHPDWKDKVPAIVHVDGTARVQTVREDQNPKMYRLLKEFEKLTGVPVLLNTSFNVRGEPIVETPDDAINCFLRTGFDYLALHDTLVSKSKMHGPLQGAKRTLSEISTMVRRGLAED